jgi:hypothetical protein
MEFWEEMSPGVKRYLVIGAVLLVGLLTFRHCITAPASGGSGPAPKRGVVH